MRWQGREGSDNVEDRRGMPSGGTMAIGGGIGTLILILIVTFLGGDPRQLMEQVGQPNGGGDVVQRDEAQIKAEQPLRDFVGVVLKDTEDVWTKLTPELRQVARDERFTYVKPKLSLFTGKTDSACGMASAAVGPFYCPGDQKVYLDFAFFQELQSRFKAPGDFAMAYVIAHEIGHHVQQLMGLSALVQQKQQRLGKVEGNQWSVRLELQADYLAGVWAHHAQQMKGILEAGDLQEALNAASHIGDDEIQKEATGRVRPDAFTHGTAAQRVFWLQKGLRSGDVSKMMEPFEVAYEDL